MSSSGPPSSSHYQYLVAPAAVLLALGGKFVREVTENQRILFEIIPPPGIDLDDPTLHVPVQPLLMWINNLSRRVRVFSRQRQQGAGR